MKKITAEEIKKKATEYYHQRFDTFQGMDIQRFDSHDIIEFAAQFAEIYACIKSEQAVREERERLKGEFTHNYYSRELILGKIEGINPCPSSNHSTQEG